MSLPMKAMAALLRLRRNSLRSVADTQAGLTKRRRNAPVPGWMRRRHAVERAWVAGIEVIVVKPARDASDEQVVYLHGGAYIHGMTTPHWWIVHTLVTRTRATVTVPLYLLAPHHTASEAFSPLRTIIETLSASGGAVTLAGDSAGGGLALSLAIQLRDNAGPPLAGLVLFSPWLDVTMTNPGIAAIAPRDPMLGVAGLVWAGEQWAGTLPVTDPRISPLFDSLESLPPIVVFQGGRDIFLPDVETFAAQAASAGTTATVQVYPDAFHVFVGLPLLPESRRALALAAAFISSEDVENGPRFRVR